MHLLRSLYDIRGVCAEKENLTLAKGGDTSRSSFNRKSLLEIHDGNEENAIATHISFSKFCTKEVIAQTDPMASKPAFLMSQLGPFLRRVGAVNEAWYCDLVALFIRFGKGVDASRKQLTPAENAAQGSELIERLGNMENGCDTLYQSNRGSQTKRGYITEELSESIKVTVDAFRCIRALASINSMSFIRPNIPSSSDN